MKLNLSVDRAAQPIRRGVTCHRLSCCGVAARSPRRTMSAKQLVFDAQARRQLKTGIDALANAVKVTLGPRGRNVAIDKKWGAPTITHDGVTVAKEIELEDPFQNMGAQMLKQAASNTNEVAGDETTTSTVMAQAIVTEGLRNLAAGANPMLL